MIGAASCRSQFLKREARGRAYSRGEKPLEAFVIICPEAALLEDPAAVSTAFRRGLVCRMIDDLVRDRIRE